VAGDEVEEEPELRDDEAEPHQRDRSAQPREQGALGGEEDAGVVKIGHRRERRYAAGARCPIAREILSAVSRTIPDHAGFIRSAGADTDSPATSVPVSSRIAAPMQRTPSSASSLSIA
jgi:hypothetical protein